MLNYWEENTATNAVLLVKKNKKKEKRGKKIITLDLRGGRKIFPTAIDTVDSQSLLLFQSIPTRKPITFSEFPIGSSSTTPLEFFTASFLSGTCQSLELSFVDGFRFGSH